MARPIIAGSALFTLNPSHAVSAGRCLRSSMRAIFRRSLTGIGLTEGYFLLTLYAASQYGAVSYTGLARFLSVHAQAQIFR